MAIVELDPLFIRALRLLHSKSKESDVQLKSLLDECIRQRKAGLPINIPTPPIIATVAGGNVKGRETEKNLDRLKRDLSQLVPGVPNKKPRMEVAGSGKMSSSSMTPSPTASLVVEETEDMDIDFQSLNDCTCYVCKSFNQENGNKLMECHTCQNLYHQECHNPVITDEEVNDPRLIWNCSTCKPAQQTTIPAKPSSISGLSKNPSKPIGSSSGSRVVSSGSSSSSSSSSNSSALPVDKRLQMMKKKSSSSSSSGGNGRFVTR